MKKPALESADQIGYKLHSPQGSGVGPLAQFSERAMMRALDVLPQPRGPENR